MAAVCCFLVMMVLLVFVQTCDFEFTVCDDDPYVYGNPHVIEGLRESAWKSWTENPLWWSLTTCTAGNWHPMTWMSHIIDGQIYDIHDSPLRFMGPGDPERWRGPEAGGHHITSVLLHAAAAVFLFLALRRLTGTFWCSALVATMFAIHPLRVESVAWVAERKDVLSGLFWMLTLWAYGGYVRSPLFLSDDPKRRPNVGWYLTTICMFMLGLASKSMLVTLPCVLLLLDIWPLRRWQPQQLFVSPEEQPAEQASSRFAPLGWLVVEKLPLFALAGIVSAIVAVGQRRMGCMSMTDNVDFPYRVANAAFSAAAYLWKMVLPINVYQSLHQGRLVCDLAVFYPHLAVMGGAAKARLLWYGLAGGLVLIAITLFVLVNLRRRPYLAVGWFWYLGALVPVIGLIQVGAQGMADRYTYLPMIGVYIMIVWGGAELAARSPELRRGLVIATGIMLTAWTALAFVQVSTWRNSQTVFQHAVDVTSDNYFAYNHLGLAYQYDRLMPDHLEKAAEQFELAVKYGPSYDAANANLGVAYMNAKQLDKAIERFEKAVKVNPYAAFHHANLAGAYATSNRLDEAAVELKEALRIEPNSAHYHQSLGYVYLRQQKLKQAIAELEEVLRLSPMDYTTMKDLAWFLSTNPEASVRNGPRAVELGEKAAAITRRSEPLTLNALAAAYAETGQFDKAVETAMEAARLAAQLGNQPLLEKTKSLIRIYSSGQPDHEPLPPPPTDTAPATGTPLSEGTAPTKSNAPPQVESERKSLQ